MYQNDGLCNGLMCDGQRTTVNVWPIEQRQVGEHPIPVIAMCNIKNKTHANLRIECSCDPAAWLTAAPVSCGAFTQYYSCRPFGTVAACGAARTAQRPAAWQ
eukprot:gene22270-biopygen20722